MIEFTEDNLPTTWQELVELKKVLPCADTESIRFDDDYIFYNEYLKLVPKVTRYQILHNNIGEDDIKIIRNTFPYNRLLKKIPHHITHYCLWSKLGPLNEDQIESEIKKAFPQKDFFWWENSPETKSMPEVWHCQIFVKED